MIKVSKEVERDYLNFVKWCEKCNGDIFEVLMAHGEFSDDFKALNSLPKRQLAEMCINSYEVEVTPYERLQKLVIDKGEQLENLTALDEKTRGLMNQYLLGLEKGLELWDESKEQPSVSGFPFDDTDEVIEEEIDESEGYFISNKKVSKIINYKKIVSEYPSSAGIRDAKLDTINHILSLLNLEEQEVNNK